METIRRMSAKPLELPAQVLADLGRGGADLLLDLGAAIEQGDDILQILAGLEVLAAAIAKGRELRRKQVRQ